MPNLFIDIEARYAKYQDSMAKMESTTRSSVKAMEGHFNGLGSAIANITAGLSVGLVLSSMRDAVEQLAALDDAADITGASVESLSSLLNTLKPSGIGLEQVTDIAGKLTRAMAGADEETSSAAAAFRALKVETKDAAGNLRPVDDVLVDLAKSLSQYADGSNKVALVQAILSKSGAQYLPLLKDLASTQREAATVTAEQAEQADKLDKSLAAMAASVNAVKIAIGSSLIPQLNEVIDKFKAARKAGLDFWDAIRQAGGAQPTDEVENLKRQRQTNLDDLQRFTKEFNDYASGKRQPQEGRVDRLRELINERGQAVARYNKEIERFQILVDTDISNGLPDGGVAQGSKAPAAPRLPPKPEKPEKIDRAELTADQKAVIEAFEALVKADAAAVALAKKIEIIDAAFFDGRASAESYDAAIQAAFKTQATAGKEDERVKLADKWKDAIDPVRQYVKELEEVRRLVREGFLTKDQGLEAEFTIQLKIDDAAFGKLEKQVDKSKGLFDDLGEAVSSSLGQGVLAGERLGDTLRSLGQSLLSIGVREFLTKPFSEFLSTGLKSGDFLGMLAGLFGGSSGGGGGGGGFTGISLPGRASGGPVVAGKAYMVGEVGPELFVPKSNGTIVPNNRLSAGGGVSIVQNITVASGATRGEVLAAMSAAKESAKREIYESMRRGGAFAAG